MRLSRLALVVAVVASGLLFVAPAAAFASWQQQTIANLGADTSELTAVSCTSPHICMAVGDISSPTEQLLSETRGPSGWTVRTIQQPGAGSNLFAVSCTKASDCIAVGRQPAGGSGNAPLAEHWNGSAWTIQPALIPPGTKSSQLFAVSCASAKSCVAVGEAVKGGHDMPFSEVWNGTHWQVKTTPKPSVQPDSDLAGVSCLSKTRCFAVGESFKNGIDKTLAEVWNGTKWAISKTPNSAKGGGLGAVSCPSVSRCMAVGENLAERWNGKSWSLLKIGKPSGSAAGLSGVSCTKAGPCYAVGDNFTEGVEGSVAERWNGSRWSVQPVPISTSFDSSRLSGVSCTTATNCTAVGSYDDAGDRSLAEDFTVRWQNASPAPFNGVIATGLNAVSCASPSACVAVGTFETSTAFKSFSQAWDGTSWNPQTMPKPKLTNLSDVSCVTATACIAVGNLSTGGGNQAPLAEGWNGIGWTIQKTPAPAGTSRDFLLGVSCPTKTSCFAVGLSSHGSAAKQRTLAERWNGTKWQIVRTPNPAGKQDIELKSVSCRSASFCVSIGTFGDGTFAQVWNGKAWKATSPVPNPKGAVHSVFQGVSCPAAKDCIAVGVTSRHHKSVPLAERWNGKKWSPLPTATPSGSGVIASALSSVSCSAGSACAAVGIVIASSDQAIAETWTGRRWVVHPIGVPPGSKDTDLIDVSCNTSVACMAVGGFNDSSSMDQMLAEQYS
ncbi:MAG TPA: hypothetical protein VFI65_09945 [Streptosporangiaceae bacterium]|nr:hypothetical protein [Streptosporangiaceae bacterium]